MTERGPDGPGTVARRHGPPAAMMRGAPGDGAGGTMRRMHRHLTAAHAALVAACDEADRLAGVGEDSDTDRMLSCIRDAISVRLEQIEADARGRAFAPPRIIGTLEEHLGYTEALASACAWQRDCGGVGPARLERGVVLSPAGSTGEIWLMVEEAP